MHDHPASSIESTILDSIVVHMQPPCSSSYVGIYAHTYRQNEQKNRTYILFSLMGKFMVSQEPVFPKLTNIHFTNAENISVMHNITLQLYIESHIKNIP